MVLGMSSAHDKSTTFDEIAHLTRGMSIWRTGDYRLLQETPPLVHLWSSMPVALGDFHFPDTNDQAWQMSDVWKFGRQFFYGIGNDAQAMLFRGRFMVMIFSAALALIVWLWSRSLFGELGGLVSLLLYTFSPTMLAHGRLVTADTTASLFFLAAVGSAWWLLRRISAGNIILSALSVSGLLLSKMSGLMIILISGVMLLVQFLNHYPITVVYGRHITVIRSRMGKLGIWVCIGCVEIVLVIMIIWAAYGFEYSAARETNASRVQFFTPTSLPEELDEWQYVLNGLGTKGDIIRWTCDNRVLPESYLYGLAYTFRHARVRVAFMNGDRSTEGWWYFFPYSFAVKTPLPLFGIMLLALLAALFGKTITISNSRPNLWRSIGQGIYRATPLWSLIVVYCIFAMGSNLNIGHRHITPIYPALFILCGCSVKWTAAATPIKRWILPVLIGMFIGASLLQWPHYLSYFNWLVGGPSNGYQHLVDSSLDWGQDLPALKNWLDEEAKRSPFGSTSEKAVYLSYFGTADPSYYGIQAYMLPSYLPWPSGRMVPFGGGIYCISASTLQQMGVLSDCRWTLALEELYQSGKRLLAAARKKNLLFS